MGKQKTPHDVRGWQIDCISYEKCPLCYGCRAYDPARVKCAKCAEHMKQNVCNVKLHRPDLLARMITRERIVVR